MIKVAVALTPVRAGCGPTLIYPGSHRGERTGDPRPVLMDPGDIMIFHANVRHTATANTSQQPRLGLWYVFALPWMRVFHGYDYGPEFLIRLRRRLAVEPTLRHVFGLADPYATLP
jgi:hypothetical protein